MTKKNPDVTRGTRMSPGEPGCHSGRFSETPGVSWSHPGKTPGENTRGNRVPPGKVFRNPECFGVTPGGNTRGNTRGTRVSPGEVFRNPGGFGVTPGFPGCLIIF